MKQSAFGHPLVIRGGEVFRPQPVTGVSEDYIQKLVFGNAECLPIADIDNAYTPPVPVCMELRTPAGRIDILMVAPSGKLIIIETKLWRNPEARRKVVAQILDYAKELARWSYEDLQRELNRNLKTSGNVLYKTAISRNKSADPGEAAFVDAVSRNLRKGEFLLLVVGDGIREGAAALTEFLSTAGNLAFSFAMVELAIFNDAAVGRIICPRVIARTVELQRHVVELLPGLRFQEDEGRHAGESRAPSGGRGSGEGAPASLLSAQEWEREKEFYHNFWRQFIAGLSLDDPGQPISTPAGAQNQYFYLPPNNLIWISAYFMKSNGRVGVYIRSSNRLEREMAAFLDAEREGIMEELGGDVDMPVGAAEASVRLHTNDIFLPESQAQISKFFHKWVNLFVNVFRPRLKRWFEDAQ